MSLYEVGNVLHQNSPNSLANFFLFDTSIIPTPYTFQSSIFEKETDGESEMTIRSTDSETEKNTLRLPATVNIRKSKHDFRLTQEDEIGYKLIQKDVLTAQFRRQKIISGELELPTVTDKNIQAKISEIRKMVVRQIKHTGHHQSNKPKTVVNVGISSREAGLKILGSVGKLISSTKTMDKISLTSEDLQKFLGLNCVPSCKFTGKLWEMKDGLPKTVRVNAYFDRGEMKIRDDLITFEIRTFMELYHNV